MTGLETIISQINQDAQQEADHLLETARAEAAQILSDAREEAEKASREILSKGETQAQSIRSKAESASQLERRNAMLAFKQQVIHEAIDSTRSALESASDKEYFDVLLQLAARFAPAGAAEMQLNSRDLQRLPADFAAALKKAAPQAEIAVSQTPCQIDSGFLLVCGGVDINCTFRAIFEDAEAELRDAAGQLLFPGP